MEEIVPLIRRARTGDSEAYGVIVGRFQDMAYAYAYAILNDFHLAQDAAQEAFIEAYRCLPSLREELAFPAWFKRIVYKHCDRLTRGKRLATAPLESIAETASPLPGPAEEAERHELARRVQEAIRELPVGQRVVTTLFYINGYSHQEIADFLEVPAKTVKSRLHASRGRLRERMLEMVEDELKSNPLPDNFTRETVEQAVAKAAELNKDHQFDQAETLLREILAKVPGHPRALKELNRTLMWGRVYAEGRWDLLPELAEQGKVILRTVDDEYVHHELARTLLAIPAMPEAVAFLEEWIEQKGRNLERLGMLAWAKGCTADYETAEKLWQDVLALSREAEADEVLFHIPFIAGTLVDCFAEAGERPRAQRAARQAWERCSDLGPTGPEIATELARHRGFTADAGWLPVYHQAGLEVREVAGVLLLRYGADAGPQAQGAVLSMRNWVDDPDEVETRWLDWVRDRIAAGDYALLEAYRHAILTGPRARGNWQAADRLARATWELLGQAKTDEAEKHRVYWSWELSNPMFAVEAKDWETAERLARRRIEESGMQAGAWAEILIAAARGLPTPRDLVQSVEEGGVASVDEYGMYGWYLVAREAAAAGDEAKAFDALRKALSYWSNPPYSMMGIWENDPYWGELRSRPEFKAAFDERRRRIGPVYGQLHYFPGW
ncbi:MAG TPA: sigma-70 family RNA polymerase sigma factor [Chloroflexota bacterium]|nr:sigma-70 family RNA polymerase sigma factor [Chloroflexota bacterium]